MEAYINSARQANADFPLTYEDLDAKAVQFKVTLCFMSDVFDMSEKHEDYALRGKLNEALYLARQVPIDDEQHIYVIIQLLQGYKLAQKIQEYLFPDE